MDEEVLEGTGKSCSAELCVDKECILDSRLGEDGVGDSLNCSSVAAVLEGR